MVNFLSTVHHRLFVLLMCHMHNQWLEKTGYLGFRKGAARKLQATDSELGDDQRPRPQRFQLLKRKKAGRDEREKQAQMTAEATSSREVDDEMLAALED